MDEPRLDRTAFRVTTLEEQGNDLAYWLTKTPEERLAHMEFLRRMNYGEDYDAEGLQRVIRIIELKDDV